MTALPTRLLTFSGSLPYGTPGEQPLEQALRPTGTKLIVELVTSTFYRDPDQAADPPGRFVIDHAVPAVADATGTWTWAITPSSYLTDNQRWRIVLPGDPQSPRFFTMPDEDSDLFNLLDPAVAPPVVPSSSIRLHVGPTAPANPSEGDLWLDTALDPPVLQVFDGGRWRITGSQGRTVFARTAPTTGIDGDWWIDISTDPWTAYVRSTGAWHQVGSTGGGGSTAGLQTQITALRNEVALLEGFEDAFVLQTPLGSETVTVAASKAQDQTNIDLPTAGVAAKLHVAATIDGQAYEHAFDVASLRALPDAGTDPLSDAADNPPAAPNALRFQWDPNDSDQSLFVGHRSGKLVLSTAEIGQTTWALTDVRIRVVLNFSDLGDTPPGNVPGTRNVQTDASGNLTYGELISGITQLDGFPSAITDGRPFIGGPGNTVIQGDVPSSGGGEAMAAMQNVYEATASLSLAQANHAVDAEQTLTLGTLTADTGIGLTRVSATNRISVDAGTPDRLYLMEIEVEIEPRTYNAGANSGGNRLFAEFYVKVNGVIDEASRHSIYIRATQPWSPSTWHEGFTVIEKLAAGDYVTFHVERVGGDPTSAGAKVQEWRINAAGSALKIDTFDITGGGGGGGGGASKFTDLTDTPSAIPAGGRVLRSTQAGGSLEFAGNVITETPQRLTALPVNPKDGRWWVADADIASQLGADTPVREDQTRNGVQEIIAAPVEVVDTIAYPVAIDTGIDGAVDVKLSSADFDSIRALPDTPVNTGPPQNTPITTFSAAQRIEKTVYNADGIPLNTLYLGHRGTRVWLSFQSAIGAAVTVKFFTGLQAEAGRHYVYISGRWEDWVHWLNQLRQAAVEAAIAADVIPASLNANSADRFPTAKMVRTMTAAEFAAATDQSGIISIPVT